MSPHATDLRDLYRPHGGESRLTLRRLLLLVRALGPGSLTWGALEQDAERAEQHDKVAQLKERAAHYKAQAQRAG